LGTAISAQSPGYFTGADGIVTEDFYPSPDCAQNVGLQFIVMDAAKTWSAGEAEEKK